MLFRSLSPIISCALSSSLISLHPILSCLVNHLPCPVCSQQVGASVQEPVSRSQCPGASVQEPVSRSQFLSRSQCLGVSVQESAGASSEGNCTCGMIASLLACHLMGWPCVKRFCLKVPFGAHCTLITIRLQRYGWTTVAMTTC